MVGEYHGLILGTAVTIQWYIRGQVLHLHPHVTHIGKDATSAVYIDS